MPPTIDKEQAQVIIENAHALWIEAKMFALAHDQAGRSKARWFRIFARMTLAASIATVVLSGFGFTQSPEPQAGGGEGSGLIWFLTALAAIVTTVAKLLEQHVGKPEDTRLHTEARMALDAEMESLKILCSQVKGYFDGKETQSIEELRQAYLVIRVGINKAARYGGVDEQPHKAAAEAAGTGNYIHITLQRVREPEFDDVPEDAPGMTVPQRGGGLQ